jgi:hypothetical protein
LLMPSPTPSTVGFQAALRNTIIVFAGPIKIQSAFGLSFRVPWRYQLFVRYVTYFD